jgi:hypothetical protein
VGPDISTPPGLECSTVSNRDKRDPLLTTLGSYIETISNGINLGLSKENIKTIRGSFSICFLLDLTLRMMDEKSRTSQDARGRPGKRLFYRSIESYRGNHLKIEARKKKSKTKAKVNDE